MARRLAVLTTGRQDWGILRSTCIALRDDPHFQLNLMAGGMHCSSRFGRTVQLIEEEGFTACETLAWISNEAEQSADRQTARALEMVTDALNRAAPEAVILVGDRFESVAAAVAATLQRIPIIHLHGGEETEGAIDNAFRHAITKMSHLHLVSHPAHADRVIQMGEVSSNVHVVGAPGLDNLHREDLAGRAELEEFLGLEMRTPIVMVTLHPTTLGIDPTVEASAVADAMDKVEATYVLTLPNSDPGNDQIRRRLSYAAQKGGRVAIDALGERLYWGLMKISDAMLGNSSSALIEAPAAGLPAVNVGDRQAGRVRGVNVIDSPPVASAIAQALRLALRPEFRSAARAAPSPFGDGRSAERILEVLRNWTPPKPPIKRWVGTKTCQH